MEILDCPAVGNHMTVEAPLVSQCILKKSLASAAGFTVGMVVSTHDRFNVSFGYAGLESGKICLVKILLGSHCIEFVADIFGTGMHRKMLCAGSCLKVVGVITLNTVNIGYTQSGCKIGILTVGLMTAAPAGISEDIYVGSPEGKSLVNIVIAVFKLHVVLGAALCGYCVAYLFHQLLVEGCCQADGLWEDGCDTRSCHTVKSLVPPVIGSDSKALNRSSRMDHLRHLLFKGHL